MFCWNSLFDVLWANTSLAVWSHFELQSLISMIQQVLVIGTSFLFPQTMKTHRTNRSLERFVATGSFAINQCLRFSRQAVEGHGTDDEAAVYCLFSSYFIHIGKALLQRAQGKLGLPSRITEHLTSILRTISNSEVNQSHLAEKVPASHSLRFAG